MLTVIRITPWRRQKKILRCTRTLPLRSFPRCTDISPSGVAAFFILEFVVMTGEAFLVCEVIYPGWKQIPESICILPRFVPIFLVVSKLYPTYSCPFVYRLDSQRRSFRTPSWSPCP